MKRILVCDDAAFMRMYIRKIAENNGYEIVGEAENGRVAVNKFKELNPDLVMMDITMPEVTGLEALKSIKDVDSNAKVIICTAMGQQPMIMEAIKYGANDFIIKPFNEEKIISSIKSILE